MRPREDVMERLVAADPAPDAERLGPAEQSDADALLAQLLATPTQAGGRRAPRTRRWALVASGALCSVAAAFAAVNLLEPDAPGPDVVERAVAAISHGGSVYHVLERSQARPLSRRFGGMRFYFEYWHTTDGRMHRKTFAADGGHRGKLLNEMAGRRRPGRNGGPALMWDARSNTINAGGFGYRPIIRGTPGIDVFSDPSTQLRMLEQQGRLRLAGTTQLGDRQAYRLVSGVVPGRVKGAQASVEFLVDSETYLPLAQRQSFRHPSGHGFKSFTRYLVYERLPLNSRTKRQLDLDPHPGAKCSPRNGVLKGMRADIGFPNPCKRGP